METVALFVLIGVLIAAFLVYDIVVRWLDRTPPTQRWAMRIKTLEIEVKHLNRRLSELESKRKRKPHDSIEVDPNAMWWHIEYEPKTPADIKTEQQS